MQNRQEFTDFFSEKNNLWARSKTPIYNPRAWLSIGTWTLGAIFAIITFIVIISSIINILSKPKLRKKLNEDKKYLKQSDAQASQKILLPKIKKSQANEDEFLYLEEDLIEEQRKNSDYQSSELNIPFLKTREKLRKGQRIMKQKSPLPEQKTTQAVTSFTQNNIISQMKNDN